MSLKRAHTIPGLINPVFLLLLTLICVAGCWYSFSEKAFPQLKTVGVIPFENRTGEYELGSRTTDLLTQKILSASTYELASFDMADGVISGFISNYERKVNTYDEVENPIDYIVQVRAKITFTQRSNNKELWDFNFEGHATFLPDEDEAQAKEEAIGQLVERIYEKMRSG